MRPSTNGPVCLITPPSVFLLDERVFMSLGILRVAAVLEQRGVPVEMLDLSGIANFAEAAQDHAAASDATVFGLTATTPQIPAALTIRDAIRAVRPDARLILGGPHITLVNAARRREVRRGVRGRAVRAFEQLRDRFDVFVTGDGEEAIFGALAVDERGVLIDADDPKSQLFLTSAHLEQLPLPARHLVDVDSYQYSIDGVRALSLICQLGCPFGCRFCGGRNAPSLRRIRLRSSDSVVAELTHLYHVHGVRGFMLYDDELNVNPRMLELMRAIASRSRALGVEFRLRGFIKSELFTDEQAAAMYEAGFRWILVGFESGSPRILRNINKRTTVEENSRCVAIAHRNGLKVKALMSVGHPGESAQTVEETRDWLVAARPDDFDLTIISVYPGSPYYDDAEPHGSLPDVWVSTTNGDRLYSYEVDYTTTSDYYKGIPGSGYRSYVFTDHLEASDIVRLRDAVELEVRGRLGIPFNPSAEAMQYEHSMGQSGALPSYILRSTAKGRLSMQVVILCGGRGTRSYPFTEYFPKVMMPIRGTPILIHLMRIYAAQGFTNFVLAAGYRKEILDDYFCGRFPEWHVDIVDTGPDSDTGERVRRCAPYLGDTFLATYGDGLGNVDLAGLLRAHREAGAVATVTAVPLRLQYGTVHFDPAGRVQAFREKPTIRDHWINAGFFAFEKRAFDWWDGDNLESHVLPSLASRGVLYTHLHEGFWKSMDTSKDQQEFERILGDGAPPWMDIAHQPVEAAS